MAELQQESTIGNNTATLIVAGGIASYKSVELLRLLTSKGIRVNVVMTLAACEFVRPLTFEVLSGAPVRTGLFSDGQELGISHIELAQNTGCIVVAPATANIIGKMAGGLADDLASAVLLAATVPVLMAPAMNTQMWNNPAVRRNLEYLSANGVKFVGPGSGELACKTVGPGRMSEPEEICRAVEAMHTPRSQPFLGKKILVTAGPTIEPIDKFRYISNYSTGKMGYALADAAAAMGADTLLVSGQTHLPAPANVEMRQVRTAAQMHSEVTSQARNCDAVIMAAAVSDFAPEYYDGKIKKNAFDDAGAPVINLQKNTDIIAELGRNKQKNQYLVGFCAEDKNLEEEAKKKIVDKNLDMIVANLIGAEDSGFSSDWNKVLLLTRGGLRKELSSSKADLGYLILDELAKLMLGGNQ